MQATALALKYETISTQNIEGNPQTRDRITARLVCGLWTAALQFSDADVRDVSADNESKRFANAAALAAVETLKDTFGECGKNNEFLAHCIWQERNDRSIDEPDTAASNALVRSAAEHCLAAVQEARLPKRVRDSLASALKCLSRGHAAGVFEIVASAAIAQRLIGGRV